MNKRGRCGGAQRKVRKQKFLSYREKGKLESVWGQSDA